MKTNCFFAGQFILSLLFYLIAFQIKAQVSPSSIPPKWYFGYNSGIDFTSGSPVSLAGNPAAEAGQAEEASTTICDPSGNVVLYSNSHNLYDGTNTLVGTIQGGTSSTQGSISFPDPASPSTQFYIVSANVHYGGGGVGVSNGSNFSNGINVYLYQKSGASISLIGGPVKIANGGNGTSTVGEQICVSSDMAGGYWIISHQGGDLGGLNYWSWHVTTAGIGAIAATKTASAGAYTFVWQGSIKVNKCQNRIAMVNWAGQIEVRNWNASSGTVGTSIYAGSGGSIPINLYGCEFSPDGSMLYFSKLGRGLYQLNISSGLITTLSTASSNATNNEIGTMQIGPDEKIYVTNGAWVPNTQPYTGVISSPNTAGAGCNYSSTGFQSTLPIVGAYYPFTYRGIVTEAWVNPNAPLINYSDGSTCSEKNLSHTFTTYYNKVIDVNSVEWDYGNGSWTSATSPVVHDFGGTGSFKVKIRFNDVACGNQWTDSIIILTDCNVLPVEWLNVEASRGISGNIINWSTAVEKENSYFNIEYSPDGNNFVLIGTVLSKEDNRGNAYRFEDKRFLAGIAYYRIAQYDFNGEMSYSKIISSKQDELFFDVYPNPSSKDFYLSSLSHGILNIKISDLLGKEVYNAKMDSDNYELNFGEDLAKGTYLIEVTSNENCTFKKIIKQ